MTDTADKVRRIRDKVGDPARNGTVDPALVELVTGELGYVDTEAYMAAADVADRLRRLHINRIADQLLAEQLAVKDQNLGGGRAVNAVDFLAETDEPVPSLLGLLVAEW